MSLENRDNQSGEGRRGSRGKKVGKGRVKESMKEEEKTEDVDRKENQVGEGKRLGRTRGKWVSCHQGEGGSCSSPRS